MAFAQPVHTADHGVVDRVSVCGERERAVPAGSARKKIEVERGQSGAEMERRGQVCHGGR